MNSAIERLIGLRVRDLMQRDVVAIPEASTMREAAALLSEHGITGAPVVCSQGRCIGILSASDFVKREHARCVADELSGGMEHELAEGPLGLCVEGVEEDRVVRHMKTAVQCISSDALMLDAARELCAAHIHRVVVLDEDERPAGILSSLDLVAAMIAAVEE